MYNFALRQEHAARHGDGANEVDLDLYSRSSAAWRQLREDLLRAASLHGRKSTSCANSILPVYTTTSLENLQRVRATAQVDTTYFLAQARANPRFFPLSFQINRTAVITELLQHDRDYQGLPKPTGISMRQGCDNAPTLL